MTSEEPEKIIVHPVSVQEARLRLPEVKSLLSRLHRIYELYKQKKHDFDNIPKTADPHEISKGRFEVDNLEEEITVLNIKLLELDCLIKDYQTGLVDFVGIRNEERVWLCFKYGEQELQYYHGWNAGYVGRKLIDFD